MHWTPSDARSPTSTSEALQHISRKAVKGISRYAIVAVVVVFTTWAYSFPYRSSNHNRSLDVKRSQCLSMKGLLKMEVENQRIRGGGGGGRRRLMDANDDEPVIISPPPEQQNQQQSDEPLNVAVFKARVLSILRNSHIGLKKHSESVSNPDGFWPVFHLYFNKVLRVGHLVVYLSIPLLVHFVSASLSRRSARTAENTYSMIRWRAEAIYVGAYALWYSATVLLVLDTLRWHMCLDISEHVETSLHGFTVLFICVAHQREVGSHSTISTFIYTIVLILVNAELLEDTIIYYHTDSDILAAVGMFLVSSHAYVYLFHLVLGRRGSGKVAVN